MRARAEAEAKAASRARVEEQVKKTLEEEKAAYVEKLTESIAKERIKSEDEKLAAQLYVSRNTQKCSFCVTFSSVDWIVSSSYCSLHFLHLPCFSGWS